ncbi:MAG: selenium cofactor biosynthesis protein YqeC, partial [Anaerolineae bacterium]
RSGRFDVILNEADGSRMRPFKAPAAHEPVIPATTTLVAPVAGLDALGRPLNDTTVHRAALVSQLSRTPLKSPITPAVIARALAHPAGGLKNVPPAARVVPLLNKLDAADPGAARRLARQLLRTARIDSVAVGSAGRDNPATWVQTRLAVVVLAAGEGRRFGSAKQLALWRGKPMLAHAVDAALKSQTGPVVVVLGARADECRAALGNRPVTVVVNPHWAQGQSTSLKAGLAALPANTGAAIFALADQPRVAPAVFRALAARFEQTLAPVVWPEFEGRRGNPVLFHRRLFPEMNRLTGDTGARPVLLAHRRHAARVSLTNPAILHDVDTPADLESDGTSVRIEDG